MVSDSDLLKPKDHDVVLAALAAKYHKLLTQIDWNDALFLKGIKEGLNKFPSNVFLATLSLKGIHKHHRTHFVSPTALQQIHQKNYKDLVFEHLIPKEKYIQRPCVEYARSGKLTVEFVFGVLRRYWLLATITKEENKRLSSLAMPLNWDGADVFARYKAAGISLVRNSFFPLSWTSACDLSYVDSNINS